MGALTGEVRDNHLQALVNMASSSDQTPLILIVRGLITQETINTTLREMWNDPLARSTAEALAFESTSLRDRIRMPMIMAGREYITSSIAPQRLTLDQDQVLLATIESLFDAFVDKGTVTSTQAAQFALTWKGTTSLLGWGGLRSTLAPDLRGPMSYLLAHRFLRRGDKTAAAEFFRQSLADANDKPQLAELARVDLELLEANEGMVAIRSQAPNVVNLSIRQDGKLISTLAVPGSSATQRLPAGNYQLSLEDESQALSISPTNVTIAAGQRHPIAISWPAQSTETKDDVNSTVQD